MTAWLGFAYLAVVAIALWFAYSAEKREANRMQKEREREQRRQQRKKRGAPETVWKQAYKVSGTAKTYEAWKTWMQERGYNPLVVLERAEDSGRKP